MQAIKIWMILLLVAISCGTDLSAQSIRTEYGKNRVQYHDDFEKWWMYETENFIIYWYGKARNIAQSAVQIAELVHPDVQNLVEHRINDKIEIIVYSDLSDLLQSNIGNEETFETTHDVTKVIGNRIFLYFDGNHKHLERSIKRGITQVYINAMYSPTSLQEIIQSEIDLQVPSWYEKGLVPYAADGWSVEIKDELKDLWLQKKSKYYKFNRLASDYPRVAGQSMWHYISERYGKTSITTLLYLMRLRNELNINLEFVFGFSEKQLKKDWQTYYTALFSAQEDEQDDPKGSLTDEDAKIDQGFDRWFPKSTMELSPDGSQLLYVVNQYGKYKVLLRDIQSGEERVLFRRGSKNKVQQPDYNYPQLAWHPSRPEITICYEYRDKIMLRRINLNNGEYLQQEIPENVQRVYRLDYMTDDLYFVNIEVNGYSDLYTYNARSRNVQAITEDFYDDVDARYVQLGDQWGVLFSSNRPEANIIPARLDTTLPIGHFDVYFLPDGSDYPLRLTNTPDQSEYQPLIVADHYVTYLTDAAGLHDRWVIDLNSRRPAYRNSDQDRNLIIHEAIKDADTYVAQSHRDGQYQILISEPNWHESYAKIREQTIVIKDAELPYEEEPTQEPRQVESKEPVGFQSKFEDPEEVEPLETNAKYQNVNRSFIVNTTKLEDREVIKFIPALAVASRRQFKLESFTTSVDNEVLFEGLQSYADQENTIDIQQPGILFKGVTKDIFEDFKIEAGIRLPTDLKGSELFVTYDDRRKRIDKRYAIYRKQRTEAAGGLDDKIRDIIWIGLHRWSYPLDTYRSIRATGQIRVDQKFLLHSDEQTAGAPRFDEKRLSLKLEYVFDNTLGIDLNLMHGTRYKVYAEAINRFDLALGSEFRFDGSRGFTTVIGGDFRHYQPILRNSILALRVAGASSFGSDRILYYVGGTDGWISPQFDQSVSVPAGATFAYKTNAPNLRGFNNNVRNGQSYLVLNSEVRIPIFKYFSGRELKSSFLRNIQVVGFFDVGSAWHGFLPNIDNSPANTATVSGPRTEVDLQLNRDVFAYGYGVGARINLFGYFIRGDYAWGVDGDIVNTKLYISLGVDF